MLSRRAFLARSLALTAGAGGAASLSFAYSLAVEPSWVEVVSISVRLPRLDAAFDGYRLVHLSDLHMDEWMTRERLGEIAAQAAELQPDLVAITGDFVTGWPPRWREEHLEDVLRGLARRVPVAAVLGNHDHWTDASRIRRILGRAGVTDVSNRVWTLRRGAAHVHIAGVDDYWVGRARLDRVLAQLPPGGAAVLLVHEPDFADEAAATGRFGLQLSGHTHGGQVRVPGVGPLILPPYGRRYPAGAYRVRGMALYTNRGVGMIPPRVRFNCRPEMTLLTLRPA